MSALSSDDEDGVLSTINEVDSESLDSNYNEANQTGKSDNTLTSYNEGKEEKKKKKKKSKREDNSHILETSQQILVDLCNEMKSLQSSIASSTSEATSAMMDNVSSNTTLLHSIRKEVDLLRSNLKQIDSTIQSKATPEQLSEIGRIRGVQILLEDAAQDKKKTIELYESHVRRGHEEIERLRDDLERKQRENDQLREELEQLRVSGGMGPLGPLKGVMYGGPATYVNGASNYPDKLKSSGNDGETIGTFDDMTLDTKQTTENSVAYETKSLKKRIVHMKKKLQIAKLEAKEAGVLRSELESMRLKMEGLRKDGIEKDRTIQRLREDIANLKRGWSGVGFASSAVTRMPSQFGVTATTTTTTTTKKNRWWNGL